MIQFTLGIIAQFMLIRIAVLMFKALIKSDRSVSNETSNLN